MTRILALTLCAALSVAACFRPPPPRDGPSGRDDRAGGETESTYQPPPVSDAARIETERLRELGPAYTPYDVGPQPIWDGAVQKALVERLAPVVEAHGLPIRTRALVWVLVGADGLAVDAVVQTSSSSDPFDRAALDVAQTLRFIPATVDGRRLPVWVIREISLLMH